MTRLFILLVAVMASAQFTSAQEAAPKRLPDEFAQPGREYRGKPFWSWNGELTESELMRQMDVLEKMGMGGFFMHSRTGLATEYLGDEWFRLINMCADEAARRHLE